MTMKRFAFMRPALAGLAIASTLGGTVTLAFHLGPAFADEDGGHSNGGHDGGHGGGGGGQGGGGHGGSGGHEEGDHDDGHVPGGHSGSGGQGSGQGAGQGGDGWRAGQSDGSGGQPVWAREGIPEVELGRLNVVRAPATVLDRAYVEALASLDAPTAAFYGLSLAEMEAELRSNWDGVSLIDSPVQNLALLRDALDGTSELETRGIGVDTETLMAAFLGTASDKAVPVTTDTVRAVTAILGAPLDGDAAASLAEDAERIRAAIADGHG